METHVLLLQAEELRTWAVKLDIKIAEDKNVGILREQKATVCRF